MVLHGQYPTTAMQITLTKFKYCNFCSIIFLITASVVALNSVYVKYVAKVQTFLTAVKVTALAMIICMGVAFFIMTKDGVANLSHPFKDSNWNPGAISVALYTGSFTYGGW